MLLQGKQPQEMWPEKCELCLFVIILCAVSVALGICSECCCLAVALLSSAFLCTTAILFISFSSRFDLIFCIFTYNPIQKMHQPINYNEVQVKREKFANVRVTTLCRVDELPLCKRVKSRILIV